MITSLTQQLKLTSIIGFSLAFALILLSSEGHAAHQMATQKATKKAAATKSVKAKSVQRKTRLNARYDALEAMVQQIEARNDLRSVHQRIEIYDAPTVRRVPSSQSSTPERVSLEF